MHLNSIRCVRTYVRSSYVHRVCIEYCILIHKKKLFLIYTSARINSRVMKSFSNTLPGYVCMRVRQLPLVTKQTNKQKKRRQKKENK